ncbi:hypothetical protein ACS7SF_20610 (plasmid) [Ralstonia sp. 25C]|uniref:hypothetical protein n=1 Tax=Ralstonia sp. 25C TaxID=3447363 RepID=UPI003F7510EA
MLPRGRPEFPATAPLSTKNGNKTGGLSATLPEEAFYLGETKEKGTEIAFRPCFSTFFYARRQKKNAGPRFPATGLPPSPFVLSEPLCCPALCSVLLCFCDVPV